MRLANMVGDRIKIFDDVLIQNVESFNKLFIECPIKDKCPALVVEILEPAPNNCRYLKIGDETVVHKMYSDLLYTLDKQERDDVDMELYEMNGVML